MVLGAVRAALSRNGANTNLYENPVCSLRTLETTSRPLAVRVARLWLPKSFLLSAMRLLRAFLGLAFLFSFSATVLAQVSAIPACAVSVAPTTLPPMPD